MYMQKKVVIFIFALLNFTAMAQDRKVAVFDPAGDMSNSQKAIVREKISSIIVNTGGYTVLEREQIDRVLRENRFQASGLVDDSQAVEMGKLMGANLVLVCNISFMNSNYHFSFKLINVETARIEKQRTTQTNRGLNDLTRVVQITVEEMFGYRLVASGRNIFQNDLELSKNEVRRLMAGTESLRLYDKSVSRNRKGNICLMSGISLTAGATYVAIVKPFEEQYTYTGLDGNIYYGYNEELNYLIGGSLLAAGVVMSITGITMKLTSKRLVRNSVNTYNFERSNTFAEVKFDFTGNGARLTLRF